MELTIPDGYIRVQPDEVAVGDEVYVQPGPGTELVGPLEVQDVDGELFAVGPDHTIAVGADGIASYGHEAPAPVTHEEGDDATRTVSTVTDDGVVLSTRPYTTDENANADAQLQAAADAATIAQSAQALGQALVDIQTIIDTPNATLNSSPAVAIKTLARAQRRLIRLAIRKLDGTT